MKRILEIVAAEWQRSPVNVVVSLVGAALLPWFVINVAAFWGYVDHGFPLQTGWHQLAIWALEALASRHG